MAPARGGHDAAWVLEQAADLKRSVKVLMGDEDVLHAIALVLGLIALRGRRMRNVLAFVMSASVGLWVGLVVQERLSFEKPMFGMYTPKAAWEPMAFCAGAALWAGVLVFIAKRTALALMTAGLSTIVSLSLLRVVNIPPSAVTAIGAKQLPTYGVVGAIALPMSFLIAGCTVRTHQEVLVTFCSSHLGLLLVLAAASHFGLRFGASSMPFSLLDEFTRIVSDVRDGRCYLWKHGVATAAGRNNLRVCDCGELCQTEIVLWIVGSWLLLAWNLFFMPQTAGPHAYSQVALDEVGVGSSGLELAGRGSSRGAFGGRAGRMGTVGRAHYADPARAPPAAMLGLGAGGFNGNGGAGYLDDETDVQTKLRQYRSWLEEGLISLGDFESKKREVLATCM